MFAEEPKQRSLNRIEMSAIEIASEVVMQFLERESPGVLAIKGNWGVGKTYFWKEFIRQNRRKFREISYSYVSLFGVSSVAELKKAIFARQQPLKGNEDRRLANRSKIDEIRVFSSIKLERA